MATTKMTVKFTRNDKGNPPGKLADAELHFTDGPLEGLKLIGFAIWETRNGARRNVTFPARQYTVNGERRSFALLALGRYSAALDDTRHAVAVLRRAGDKVWTARALNARGLVYHAMGLPARADASFAAAERFFAETSQVLESVYMNT